METNMSINSNLCFEGKVDRHTKKFAKKIGEPVLDALKGKAEEMHKNTVLRLEEIDGKYILSAFNPKLGFGRTIQEVKKADGISALTKNINDIDSRQVDVNLVKDGIEYLKNSAPHAYSTPEYNTLKHEAKDNLKVQRELGVQYPFWSEVKALREEGVAATNKYWFENAPKSPYPIAQDVA